MFVSMAGQAHAHCAVCPALQKGRSKSCIFEMPLGQVVIGSVPDGGGTGLTRGSGLLIE